MAFIAKTAFEPRITNNEFDELCNVTGRYQEEGKDADCSAGLLVVRGDRLPNDGFDGVLNENAHYMNAATADANIDSVIFASNTYDNQLISNGSEAYFVGTKTLGLGIPAGRDGTYTIINFDGRSVYRFGEGNINGSVGENKFFTIEEGRLVPAAAAPTAAGSIYFKLNDKGNFTEGTAKSFGYYDVIACKVSAVAGA